MSARFGLTLTIRQLNKYTRKTNMKSQLSMRNWAVIVIILPTLFVSVLLGSVLVYKRYAELNTILVQRGIYLAEPLALLSAKSLQQGEMVYLSKALDLAHRRGSPIINRITLYSPDHSTILSTNRSASADLEAGKFRRGHVIPNDIEHEIDEDFIYIRAPIWGELYEDPSQQMVQNRNSALFGYLVVELSRDRVLLQQQNSLIVMIGILILALAISLGIARTFIIKLIKPIELVNKTIKKLLDGETKTRILTPMVGELNRLRLGINGLGKALHHANERAEHNISEHTQELQQTVEQLEEQNVELSIARKDAQAANDVKSQFLANMSHELRTPLNGVLGFTRQLKKTPLNTNQRDFLSTIDSSANNLLRIINDILDFSKLDAGKMEMEDIPFSLRDTVNEAMTLMAPTVFEKGLDIHIGIDSAVPDALRGDPDRLKQVLLNLLGNALKFTNHGFIRLDVEYKGNDEKGHRIKFLVSDTGIGIDEEGKKKLFAAFGQADSSVTRKYGGTGLGLSICKKIIQTMGGTIRLTSEVDKGSCFYFDMVFKENSVAVAQTLPIEPLNGLKLLIFDTNEQSLKDTTTLLGDMTGLIVSTASTNKEFEDKLSAHEGLVLINSSISPSTLGHLQQLVKLAHAKCKYVFTMIGSISPNLKEALIGSGATACLSKPLNHSKLIETLAKPFIDSQSSNTTARLSFKGVKVLAADDNPANLKLLSTLLTELSVVVDTAHDGEQALAAAQKRNYDLIFMDIQMPIMDGVTACKKIKGSSLNESTPIVSVTAHAAPEEQESFMKAGFDDFLAKPIDEEALKQILIEHVGDADKLETLQASNTHIVDVKEAGTAPEYAGYHHVDWPMALERAAGKKDLAVQMLEMLIKSITPTIDKISRSYDADNRDELLQAVHKFHGACCYTGVPKLKKLAEEIEVALKKGKSLNYVEPEVLELLEELEKFRAQAKTWKIGH